MCLTNLMATKPPRGRESVCVIEMDAGKLIHALKGEEGGNSKSALGLEASVLFNP